ncbi:MAG: shikimate kinase [Myxococcota bacterium]
MDLLVVFGPQAAGKMTVGRALVERTRYRLFHNHMTLEPVLGLFAFGEPAFRRLVGSFRRQILDECLAQDAFDLIFTFTWALDEPEDAAFVRDLAGRVEDAGGVTRYLELVCPLEERLRRNRTPLRLQEKASKRDVAASDARLRASVGRYRFTSAPGEMEERLAAPYLRLDNEAMSADEVAEHAIAAFAFPRTG